MKKIFLLVFLVWFFYCEEEQWQVEKHEIRQLIKSEKTEKFSRASFFLIAGSYGRGEKVRYKLNLFAKDKEGFQFAEIDLDRISINIDNDLEKPYLETRSKGDFKRDDLSDKIRRWMWDRSNLVVILHCPERYLPEKLLPIVIGEDGD